MPMSSTAAMTQPSVGAPLRAGLWVAQALIAALFCFAGFTKLTTPIPELAAMMPWTGDVPAWFVRSIALVDLAGGIGVLLPALTGIQPRLTTLAALGCIVLQLLAAAFHVSRGEFSVLPVNALLLACAVFVFWGRSRDPRFKLI